MKINCLIVDDEPLARDLLKDYVGKVQTLGLIDSCANALEAMGILRQKPVDLIFLDIQMPEITGINMLKVLKDRPMVILTTAYSDYALESYELDVVDYLLKPITLERFLMAIDKVVQRMAVKRQEAAPQEGQNPAFVFIKDGTRLVKVMIDDILYVEGLKDYVTLHTRQQKIVTLQRLKSLEEILPSGQFIRIHHSYIVAIKAIDSIHKGEVWIGPARLPVSDSYKKAFKERIDLSQWRGGRTG